MNVMAASVVANCEDDAAVLELYGDGFYLFVEALTDEDAAPKITGMILDTGRAEVVNATWQGLQTWIKEGQELLDEEAKEKDDNYSFNLIKESLRKDGFEQPPLAALTRQQFSTLWNGIKTTDDGNNLVQAIKLLSSTPANNLEVLGPRVARVIAHVKAMP